ncbi:DUF6352 family protein [Caenimonas aquaedulcis]|uniref:Uncharacterized protein n=1 Tax=Caenimonas aquaedulcis TaxID=2793270 RepID=A0A931MIG6_9BURK|nr:hypothetical protein [Caenimonas aquaedulcis]
MKDFWRGSGYALLGTTPEGHLVVTNDFLRSLLMRPELAPVNESGPQELALHEALMAQPRMVVDAALLDAIEDPDARDNYAIWLRFRERLLAHPTLEASYAALFRGEGVDVPPLFVHQLTQILLRHILGARATAMQARVAEMLFRTQRIAIQDDGQVMAADEETVERHAVAANFGTLGELLKHGGAPIRAAELDVLHADAQERYWDRDESHDLVISLNHGQPALDALCRVLERWVKHFLGTPVRIQPEKEIDEEQWVWHVGLDAVSSSVLNDLYQGHEVAADRMAGMLCLFRLDFEEPGAMRAGIAGRPVYLAMGMDADKRLKLKPQNLLLNLPLARSD